jgi:hypothetical protein
MQMIVTKNNNKTFRILLQATVVNVLHDTSILEHTLELIRPLFYSS